MTPKKANTFYIDVAEDLDISKDLVEDLIQFFYKDLRNNLSALSHPRLNVEGLGQFVAKSSLVRKSIPRYKKALDSHDTSTFSAYYNKKMIEDKVECLENLEKMIRLEESKKEFIKALKDEYTKNNMEK